METLDKYTKFFSHIFSLNNKHSSLCQDAENQFRNNQQAMHSVQQNGACTTPPPRNKRLRKASILVNKRLNTVTDLVIC